MRQRCGGSITTISLGRVAVRVAVVMIDECFGTTAVANVTESARAPRLRLRAMGKRHTMFGLHTTDNRLKGRSFEINRFKFTKAIAD